MAPDLGAKEIKIVSASALRFFLSSLLPVTVEDLFTSKFLVPSLITLFVTTLNWIIKLPASPGGRLRVLLSLLTTLVPASDTPVLFSSHGVSLTLCGGWRVP